MYMCSSPSLVGSGIYGYKVTSSLLENVILLVVGHGLHWVFIEVILVGNIIAL